MSSTTGLPREHGRWPTRRRALILGAASSLAAPALVGRAQERQTLRLAHSLPRTHPVHAAITRFVELVRDGTDAAVAIDVFPDGELGQEVQIVALARAGRLDIVKASASVLERTAPAYGIFNLPFILRDSAHWRAVTSGPIGRDILASSEPAGLVGLTFYEAGSRSFYAQRPIDHPDALKGLRIRIQPSPTMAELITLFGATPVPLDWDVTYEALSTGLVNGAENSVVALIVGRHGEVVRNYSFDEHTIVPDVLAISAARWAKLSGPHRQVFRDAAAASFDHMNAIWGPYMADARRKVEAMGVTFTQPDKRPFVERSAPLTERFKQDDQISGLMARIALS